VLLLLIMTAALVATLLGAGQARAEPSSLDRTMATSVLRRLLVVCPRGPDSMTWPPELEFGASPLPNCYATLREIEGSPQKKAVIVLEEGEFTRVVRGSASVLALDVGHELAHFVLNHFALPDFESETALVKRAAERELEYAADRKGVELLLAAGYSFKESLKAFSRLIEMDLDFPPALAGRADHPACSSRLARLAKDQESFWDSMSAFRNGSLFLAAEQYTPAAACFAGVTRDFPLCCEAWANLGYARLMQYLEALRDEDLRRWDVGHLVCGAYYERPDSMIARVRGVHGELWAQAVEALAASLRLEPELVMARANLGIAWLVHPSGEKRLDAAVPLLREAASRAGSDRSLRPRARASVLINAAAALLAQGCGKEAAAYLDRAEGALREERDARAGSPPLVDDLALLFNRALVLESGGAQGEAAQYLERYLELGERGSSWWSLAYDRYVKDSRAAGAAPRARGSFVPRDAPGMRAAYAVELPGGRSLMLSQRLSDVKAMLGPCETLPVAVGMTMKRLVWPRAGIEVVGIDDVLALCLKGEAAPSLAMRRRGAGAGAVCLKVGMKKEELDSAMEGQDVDDRPLVDRAKTYGFYRGLGVAVRVEGGVVTEIVVAQVPAGR